MPTVRQTLVAYSQKQATTDQVMRAVMQHDDWFVPSIFAHDVLGRTEQQLVLFGDSFHHPAQTLLLYTDLASAVHAHQVSRVPLGPFARGIRGVDVFAALPADTDVVVVNIGCPTEHKLYLGGPRFNDAPVWADVVRFERVLEDEETPALELARQICAYDAYFVAMHEANGAIVTLEYPEFGSAGILFTAPDCLAAFRAGYPDLPVQTGQTTGARITSAMASLGVDGFVINPFGPGVIQVVSVEELQIAMLAEAGSGGEVQSIGLLEQLEARLSAR